MLLITVRFSAISKCDSSYRQTGQMWGGQDTLQSTKDDVSVQLPTTDSRLE